MTRDELRNLYEAQHLSLRAIAKQKGCHPETIRHHLISHGIIRRSVSEAKIKFPRKSFSENPIGKAYMLGFRAGDLHVHTANYSPSSETIIVACVSTVSEQIDLVRSLFEIYGHINLSKSRKQTAITVYLDRSFSFLLNREDRVEDWILANEKYFASYLAGYIDAEGCIQVKRYTRASEVVIRSYDVNILRACWTALEKLNIICPPVYLVKSKGTRDADGPLYHQDYWGLGIFRQQSLLRLFALIDPCLKHPKRRQDMLLAWGNVKARQIHVEGT